MSSKIAWLRNILFYSEVAMSLCTLNISDSMSIKNYFFFLIIQFVCEICHFPFQTIVRAPKVNRKKDVGSKSKKTKGTWTMSNKKLFFDLALE